MTPPLLRAFLFSALVALALAVRLPYLATRGSNVDEGAFVSAASLLNRGAILYVDIITNKPPGIYLLLAGLFRVLGEDVVVARGLAVLAGALATALVYAIGARAGGWPMGAGAAFLFALDPFAVFWGRTVMTEPFIVLASLAAVWLTLLGLSRERGWFFALAGVALGLGTTVKPTSLAGGVPVLLLLLLDARPFPARVRRLALVACGIAGSVLLVLAVSLARGVSVPLLISLAFGINLEANLQEADLVATVLYRLKTIFTLTFDTRLTAPFLLAALLVPGFSALRHQWRVLVPIVAWLAAELAFPLTARNFGTGFSGYSHYYLAFLPALTLLAGAGVAVLAQAVVARNRVLLFALGLLFLVWARTGVEGTRQDLLRLFTPPTFPSRLADERSLADAVRRHSGGGAVYSLAHPGVYFWTGIEPASPFLEPAKLYRYGQREAYLRAFRDALEGGTATVVVTTKTHEYEMLEEELALLRARYRLVEPRGVENLDTFEGYRIYARRSKSR